MGHGWLWPAISNHGGSWLFMARHEQPLSQSGQNQTQAFKAPKPNGDISEKSHIVSHSPTVLSHRETNEHFCNVFVMFCCNLMSMVSLRYITMRSISNLEEIIRYHKRSAWRQSSEIISQDTGSILQLTMALGVLFVEGIVKRFAGIHLCPFWAKLSNSRQYQ